MPKMFVKKLLTAVLFLSVCAFGSLDTSRYIPLEEIEPGMTGYALTVYSGTKIEKFPVEVISVVKDHRPGKNAIFVMGTDERFIHTGPVQGCSGSPVILDGRIAGALAFGWSFVKDPLYGVTPIAEMIDISERKHSLSRSGKRLNIDYSNLDFEDICRQLAQFTQNRQKSGPMGLQPLEVPIVSSFSEDVTAQLKSLTGITMFSGAAGGNVINPVAGSAVPNFEAGSVVAIPMVDGDIKLAAIGTITDVVGDEVYAFGHSFMAEGETKLPMATGLIHMVVANQIASFKYGQSGQTIGAITADAATGIYGRIGEKAPMIPLNITINRSDNPQTKVYNCEVAVHDFYTAMLTEVAIAGAALSQGNVPKEHTVSYKARIGIKGYDDIHIERTSSGRSIGPAIFDIAGAIAVLINNRFHNPEITGIDYSIDIKEGERVSQITFVETDKLTVKPGDTVNINIVTEKLYSQKTEHTASITIPRDMQPGRHEILIGGADFYNSFVRSAKPYTTKVDGFDRLLEVLRAELSAETTGIYAVLRTEDNGISIGKSPLVGLPTSRALTLASPQRNYAVEPIFDWQESRIDNKEIVQGQQRINILVEEK